MLHGGGLEKASPARTIETHSPPRIEKTLNIMLIIYLIIIINYNNIIEPYFSGFFI